MKSPAYFRESFHPFALVLWPLSLLFGLVAGIRRLAYRVGLLRVHRVGRPVIVIGNITVGGTGKTPLVSWAARHLQRMGLRPGVVSRGYGGTATTWPQQVRADSDPRVVGDEAVLVARHAGCPVAVGPDRVAAARALLTHQSCDILLSDDGLQHYALGRDLEIAVLDGVRRLGNGMRLPAGPLREGPRRLRSVDMVVVNGQGMAGEFSARLRPGAAVNLVTGERRALRAFRGIPVHAVAGIGHPARFFDMLGHAGLEVMTQPFGDHHRFAQKDVSFCDGAPVLMTEKDAVKCEGFAETNHWSVPVELQPDAGFVRQFTHAVEELVSGQETARHSRMPDLQG